MTEFTRSALDDYRPLDDLLAERALGPAEWEQPRVFDLSDEADILALEEMIRAGEVRETVDKVDLISNDLFELRHPDQAHDPQARANFVDGIAHQGLAFGKWFYFPWSGTVVRYADQEDHQAIRTARHRNLNTWEEQRRLLNATVVACGLSVGSNALESMVRLGVGGKIVFGDPDTLKPSNLNRMNAVLSDTGTSKVSLLARKISEIDPYIEQVHLNDGLTAETIAEIDTHEPDVIIEEVDDLRAKAMVRIWAQRHGVPVVTATDAGRKSILDVERYDLEPHRLFGKIGPSQKLFNGRISTEDAAALAMGAIDGEQQLKFMMKLVGLRHITPRLIESVIEMGRTTTGIPQLGTTAARGGSQVADTVRDILLGEGPRSGRTVSPPERLLTDSRMAFKALRMFSKAQRERRNLSNGEPRTPFVSVGKALNLEVEQTEAAWSMSDLEGDIPLIEAAVRATPSAHNTQPWQIRPVGPRTYDLYHKDTGVPEPHDLVTYLNSGALVESFELTAPNFGAATEFTEVLRSTRCGLLIGRLVLRELGEGVTIDPLSDHVAERFTNRVGYHSDKRLPVQLTTELEQLGNVLVPPNSLVGEMEQAGSEAWASRTFVEDLKAWFRTNNNAKDGITPGPFNIPRPAIAALKLAFRRGGFKSGLMRRGMASAEVKALKSAPAVAVIGAEDSSPEAIFDAGRRLMRSWVAIVAAGVSYHPQSGPVFTRSTVGSVAKKTGIETPVAMYRVGYAKKNPRWRSNRKNVIEVLDLPAA